MECKNCQAELEEGVTLCPQCGFENAAQEPEAVTEPAPEEAAPVADAAPAQNPINKAKLAGVIVGLLAVVAVIVCAIVGATGGFKKEAPTEPTIDVTIDIQEPAETTAPVTAFTPSMSEEEAIEAMSRVVGHMGSSELTNGQLSAYYWMSYYEFANQLYSYYGVDPSAFGLDLSQPMSEQACMFGEEGQTWEDYFLAQAIDYWAQYEALAQAAAEQGIELSQEDQDQLAGIEETLAQSAASYGYESADEMLAADFGAGVSMAHYKSFLENMLRSNQFYAYHSENMAVTDEEVEAYYDENPAVFEEAGIAKDNAPSAINVRHILVIPEGDQGENGYTEEQMAAARAKAQEILDQWLAGEATEESFAALAGEHTQDPGSKSTGGLYEDVTPGQMVVPFNDWCFNPERQVGDTGLVQTTYGIHVMYFSGVSDETPYWYATAKNQLLSAKLNELVEAAIAAHPHEIDREAVVISEVDLVSAY